MPQGAFQGIFTNYEELEKIVLDEEALHRPKDVRLTGILFMRQDQELAAKSIKPSLDYFHEKSGEHLNFFLAGWRKSREWLFDPAAFVKACDVVAAETAWRYSGGVDLLLFVTRKRAEHEVVVDLKNAISVRLDRIAKDKWGESPDVILEHICNFARNSNAKDPLLALSLQEMRVAGASALVDAFLAYLPEAIRGRLRYANEFLIQDISRPTAKAGILLKRHVQVIGE